MKIMTNLTTLQAAKLTDAQTLTNTRFSHIRKDNTFTAVYWMCGASPSGCVQVRCFKTANGPANTRRERKYYQGKVSINIFTGGEYCNLRYKGVNRYYDQD